VGNDDLFVSVVSVFVAIFLKVSYDQRLSCVCASSLAVSQPVARTRACFSFILSKYWYNIDSIFCA